jgi:hypothetical protein
MYQAFEPDSGYGMPFITKVVDGEAAQSIAYSSEVRSIFCFLVDMFRNSNFIWIVCKLSKRESFKVEIDCLLLVSFALTGSSFCRFIVAINKIHIV